MAFRGNLWRQCARPVKCFKCGEEVALHQSKKTGKWYPCELHGAPGQWQYRINEFHQCTDWDAIRQEAHQALKDKKLNELRGTLSLFESYTDEVPADVRENLINLTKIKIEEVERS